MKEIMTCKHTFVTCELGCISSHLLSSFKPTFFLLVRLA